MMRSRLRERRLELNMSYQELAQAIGVSERAVRYIEKGERQPSWKTARKLSETLGLTLEEVMFNDSDNHVA
ncbi:helix-turn-helix transcriptional regulator [Alicyclobacillus acidocaldarius]|nr:helix-turn-helix transcriptional regulator [Alicyclobacillus acidocaldarius]